MWVEKKEEGTPDPVSPCAVPSMFCCLLRDFTPTTGSFLSCLIVSSLWDRCGQHTHLLQHYLLCQNPSLDHPSPSTHPHL